jgi:hypothetical protein
MITKARYLMPSAWLRPMTLIGMLALLQACTTTTIDEFRQGATGISSEDSVVILGRNPVSPNDADPSQFVECVGERMASGDNAINVIPEQQFVDAMFPWFEPRMAPKRNEDLQLMMAQPMVTDIMSGLGVRYIVWLDGQTERTNEMGQLSCGLGTGGGGCVGFVTWEDDSSFEARVWDISSATEVGTISADAVGQTYIPAIVIPIPLIARVEANACSSLADQLKQFVQGD